MVKVVVCARTRILLSLHVLETIKDKASRVFKTFKDKVMGLYNRVKGENTGNERETRIEDQNQPYQLRGPLVKQPTSNTKQIKRMKKKLGKLNKKIRHSKRKHNNLISKRHSIKKKIKELKRPCKSHEPKEKHEHESFNPIDLEQTYNRASRSDRINGRSRMDVDTFFDQIRQNLIGLMNKELTDLGSARVQTTAWIRFRQALEDDLIGFNRERLPFNSRMTETHQGSNLDKIIDEMLTHMKTQIETQHW